MEGIYSIVFRGEANWGMGMLIFHGGLITGADDGGALYDGTYVERGSNIEMAMVMTVPPGTVLVQGTAAQPTTYTVPINEMFPKSALETNEPVFMDLPPGPVNVIFRRLRSLGE